MWPGSIFIDSADQYNSAGAPIISFAIFDSGIIAPSVVKDNLHRSALPMRQPVPNTWTM